MMDMSKGFDHSTSSNIRNIRKIKSPETEFNGFKSRAVFIMSVVKPKPKYSNHSNQSQKDRQYTMNQSKLKVQYCAEVMRA